MKKIIILIIMVLSVCTINAQLKVQVGGKVLVGSSDATLPAHLNVFTKGTSANGIYSYSEFQAGSGGSSGTYSSLLGDAKLINACTAIGVKGLVSGEATTGTAFGVIGEVTTNTTGRNYGVFGHIPTNVNGAAIYGTTHTSCLGETLTGNYAGYFEGNVLTSGNLGVTGGINGVALGFPGTLSNPYRGTGEGSSELSGQLRRLELSTFFLNRENNTLRTASAESAGNSDLDNEMLTKTEKQILSKQHYGLSANQLEEVFPDLVYENEDGTKCINYVEMVPILVEVINEMGARLEALENGGQTSKRAISSTTDIASADEGVTVLSLGQNKPNPFGETTSIAVSVPEDVQTAFLYVYNLNGSKVAQVDIPARGITSVSLSAATLSEGMYLYSLVADGKIVQTRRMIVEK